MPYTVKLADEFQSEYEELSKAVQDGVLEGMTMLREDGPQVGRPHADTLKNSKYRNMKELRFDAGNGVWRIAFAFDPKRQGILLTAIDKSGMSQKKAYDILISRADVRYAAHLKRLKAKGAK